MMRPTKCLTLVAAVAMLAGTSGCSATRGVPDDARAAPDAAADSAATDAAPAPADACPEGTHPADGGACAAELSWAHSSTAIAPARDHHASVIIERGGRAYLYVLGGTTAWTSVLADVQRAAIRDDGTLDAFEPAGALPEPRAGHTAVELDGRLVVAGGLTDDARGRYVLDTTVWASIRDDGTLGPWVAGPRLPQAVMHHSCNVSGGAMYCVGGRIAGNLTCALAVRTAFDAAGALGEFEDASPLPHGLGFHQAFVAGGALYLAGGLRRDAASDEFAHLTEVLRARFRDDGGLGPWEPAGELPESLNVGAAQVFADRVYFVGGMNGADEIERRVRSAGLDPAGALSNFTVLPDAPAPPRMHVHQAPRYRRWMYLVGGRLASDASSPSVEIGSFQ